MKYTESNKYLYETVHTPFMHVHSTIVAVELKYEINIWEKKMKNCKISLDKF